MLTHDSRRSQTTTSPLSLRFRHRTLDNGSVESICMNCFLTISRTWGRFELSAEELNEIEFAHECQPRRKPANPQNSN
jgi:hypothetical protein